MERRQRAVREAREVWQARDRGCSVPRQCPGDHYRLEVRRARPNAMRSHVNDVIRDMYRETLVESDLRSRPVLWELERPGQR